MSEAADWRSRRWAGTHQRIYDVALDLFRENGFGSVSVGQIARAAGVSVPTFYAHYPSKEHVLMQMPTAEEMRALVAALPRGLPLRERLRSAAPLWLSSWTPGFRDAQLARWRIIAGTPGLRTRAAEFERVTAGLLTDALREEAGGTLRPVDAIIVSAYLATWTAGVLAWADCNGERELEELVDEAFLALRED